MYKIERAKEILLHEGIVSFMKKLGTLIYRRTFDRYFVLLMKHIFKPHHNERYINIGGGQWYYPRWENVDYYANKAYVDYCLDLRTKNKLPFQDECAALIFSSHFFEHISDEDCLFVLGECYRILKRGGTIRISVPDMEKAFTAYRNNDHNFFCSEGVSFKGNTIERKLVNVFASYAKEGYSGGPLVSVAEVRNKLQELDKYSFCRWCVSRIPKDAPYKAHVNAYNFDKLKDFLDEIGFQDIKKSDYRLSSVTSMRAKVFDNRPVVSLYVEAIKR